jgi:hypothetical protein
MTPPAAPLIRIVRVRWKSARCRATLYTLQQSEGVDGVIAASWQAALADVNFRPPNMRPMQNQRVSRNPAVHTRI